ncbi:MAG: cation diffusion facilitator family transporter [Candidatus Coproplasma sp.]
MARTKREQAGIVSGVTGIVLNVILCVFKFIVGVLTLSISIIADAFNNLSDAVSNVVTIIGSVVSDKPVDKEHPFGHGRMEYISALIVAFLIFVMGFELGKSSIERIISPEALNFELLYIFVPVGSVCVKAFFAIFNHVLYKKTGNLNLKAIRQDSINDCIATSGTIVALTVASKTSLIWFDGAIGLCVSLFVVFSGIGILKDVLGPLIGQAPSKELVENIKKIMLEEEYIVGIHDVIVHDYGASKIIASAHAEMPADVDVVKLHSAIDRAEKRIESELHVAMCIHIDPVKLNDEETERYRALTQSVIKDYCADFDFHDFRIIKREDGVTVIFELVIPYGEKRSPEEISAEVEKRFKDADGSVKAVIKVEHAFS